VPVTHRFPAAGMTGETEWQEAVVRHLGLVDWQRIEVTSELDCVGPVAAAVLRRHGVLWPCNAYFHEPILAAAGGGTVVTGVGGDEVFTAPHSTRAVAVLSGRARPVRRDVLRVGFALAPASLRRAAIRRSLPDLWPWLTPPARRGVVAWAAADLAQEPLRRRTHYRRLLGAPVIEAGLASLEALARAAGAEIAHPFRDPHFLASLAALPHERRHATRTEAMTDLFGDLLPPEVLGRSTKARFDEVFWAGSSRAFVADWDGSGVDPALVDVDRLRAEWASPSPDTHTVTLMQAAWLTRDRAAGPRPRAAMSNPGAG